jgi:hypothetical protein
MLGSGLGERAAIASCGPKLLALLLTPGDPRGSMRALTGPSWFDASRHRPGTDPRVYRELGTDLRYRVERTLAIELGRARARLGGNGRWWAVVGDGGK